MKKSILLFAFTGLILSANAQYTIASGICGASGNNLTWVLTSDSVFTISGSGDMFDYSDFPPPWYTLRNSIATVVIGDSITSIGEAAFHTSENLTSVNIPNSVVKIGPAAFLGTGLTCVSIPDSVTTVGRYAFAYCESLVSASIGNSVTTIEEVVFFDCENLAFVSIGNSVNTIERSAFMYCKKLTSVTIPNSVIMIDSTAFAFCHSLTSVNIGNSVNTIGFAVFYDCSSLLSIDVDPNNVRYSSRDGILYSKFQDTLFCCPGGKKDTIVIPNSVTMIGFWAFNHCAKLTSVIIPNTVTEIDRGAFANCYNLVSANIPDLITKISHGTFANCSNLRSIDIGNLVTTIDTSAFFECYNLIFVSMGKSVTKIEEWAFYDCNKLDTIICKANNPPAIGQTTFFNVPQNVLVCVPCGSLWNYKMSWYLTNYAETGIQPAVPVNVNIAEDISGFTITWQGDADLYNIFRNYNLLATVSTNSYTDYNLRNGINYCYDVQAIGEECESEISGEVCKTFSGVGIVRTGRAPSLPQVFPNPAQTHFTVTNTANATLHLYNMVGQEVLQTYGTGENTVIDVSLLPQGVYVLKVVKDGSLSVHKIVVSG